MDSMEWADDVFGDADLGDRRRTDRLVRFAGLVANGAESTLSSILGNEADNKAAHRFLGNEFIDDSDIIEPAIESTISKINKLERVLLIQDTSHLNYDSHISTTGLGHIGSTKDRSFQGIMMHWTLALTAQAEPIGVAQLKLWERKKDPRKKQLNEHQRKPIQKKESYKWIESVKDLDGQIKSGVQVIWISDRESDIYDFIDVICDQGQDFVIRSNANRSLVNEERLLRQRAEKAPVCGVQRIDVLDSEGRKKSIEVEIRSCAVELEAPVRKGGAKTEEKCSDRKIHLVYVKSRGRGPKVDWLLLTTLPVFNLESCLEVIWFYKQRWHIESIHKTLKSGFKVEELRLSSADRLRRAVSAMLPCAIRVYWLSNRNRYLPDKPANLYLTKTECRILALRNKKKKTYVPTVKEAWIWIGWMGGFRGSKNSSPPGQITFWRGYTKLKNMAAGAEMLLGN